MEIELFLRKALVVEKCLIGTGYTLIFLFPRVGGNGTEPFVLARDLDKPNYFKRIREIHERL